MRPVVLRVVLALASLPGCAAGEAPEPPDPPAPVQTAPPAPPQATPGEPTPPAVTTDEVAPPLAGSSDGPDAAKLSQAAALRDGGDLPGMRKALLELLRDHPQSPLVPHAYLMLGDEMFRAGDFAAALRLFDKVLTYPAHDLAAYALYRSAWCHVDLRDDTVALETFLKAAQRAQQTGEAGRRLVHASIRDSVAPYVRVGKLATARSFYGRVVRGTDVPLDDTLVRVATSAIDGGRRDELARVCEAEGSPPWCAGPLAGPPAALQRTPAGE